MTYLVADDEILARNALELALHTIAPDCEVVQASGGREALRLCGERSVDVAFLDVEMPGLDGLALAGELRRLYPEMNIILVTGHTRYALEAHRLYVSGYLVKPVTERDLREALRNLRHPARKTSPDPLLKVRCFGKFEVFHQGEPVHFRRRKSKELLAYLVSLRGASATTKEICEALWNTRNGEDNRTYFRQVASDLRSTLRACGAEEVLLHHYNNYAVDAEKLDCDYYQAADRDDGKPLPDDFMTQYHWARDPAVERRGYIGF